MAIYGNLLIEGAGSNGITSFGEQEISALETSLLSEMEDFNALTKAANIISESGADYILQEGVFSDIGGKIKGLWDRFVAWFKKVIKAIKEKIAWIKNKVTSFFKGKKNSSSDSSTDSKSNDGELPSYATGAKAKMVKEYEGKIYSLPKEVKLDSYYSATDGAITLVDQLMDYANSKDYEDIRTDADSARNEVELIVTRLRKSKQNFENLSNSNNFKPVEKSVKFTNKSSDASIRKTYSEMARKENTKAAQMATKLSVEVARAENKLFRRTETIQKKIVSGLAAKNQATEKTHAYSAVLNSFSTILTMFRGYINTLSGAVSALRGLSFYNTEILGKIREASN